MLSSIDVIDYGILQGYKKPKEYIATQGPTKFTINDLWHMAWQEKTTIIVMVTNTIELSRVGFFTFSDHCTSWPGPLVTAIVLNF